MHSLQKRHREFHLRKLNIWRFVAFETEKCSHIKLVDLRERTVLRPPSMQCSQDICFLYYGALSGAGMCGGEILFKC